MLQHCIDAHQLPTLTALHSHGASHHLALHSLDKPRHPCHARVVSGGRVSVHIPEFHVSKTRNTLTARAPAGESADDDYK